MVRRFFKDSAIYGLGKLLVYGVGFFLIPIYTRAFEPAQYGVVDLLQTLQRLALLTVALEIAQAAFRFLPETDSMVERRGYASTALWFTLAAFAVFLLAGWAGAPFFSRLLLGEAGFEGEFRVALLAVTGAGVFNLLHNMLRLQMNPRRYTLVSLLNSLLSILCTIFFIVVLQAGIAGVFWGQLIGTLAGSTLAYTFTRQDYGMVFDRAKLKEMLRFSLPLVPSSAAVFVYLYVDRLTVNALMDTASVGLFGVGYRITSMVGLLLFGFQIAMTPLVYSHYREAETPGAIARIFRYFATLALTLTVSLSLFAREIVALLATPEYFAAWGVIPLLVPATLLASMYIFTPGLQITKKTGRIAAINVGGAVLNTALNLALIPALGIQGAGLATLTTTAAVFAAHLVFSQRHYPVPHDWKTLGLGVVIAGGVSVAGLQLETGGWASIALKLLLCLGVGAFFLLVAPGKINWRALLVRSPVPHSTA